MTESGVIIDRVQGGFCVFARCLEIYYFGIILRAFNIAVVGKTKSLLMIERAKTISFLRACRSIVSRFWAMDMAESISHPDGHSLNFGDCVACAMRLWRILHKE
jgi:hypothetical protein